MNFLYLEVGGNFTDILHMDYWRFNSILKSLGKLNAIKSGKPYTEAGVPRSSKDMIEKRKKQR
jgi:hypothetical protein